MGYKPHHTSKSIFVILQTAIILQKFDIHSYLARFVELDCSKVIIIIIIIFFFLQQTFGS